MNASPPPLPKCSVCQTTLDPNGTCPRCRAPEDWQDQIDALDFVVRRLKAWRDDGRLTERQFQALTDDYQKRRQAMTAAASAQQVFVRDKTFPPRDECWSCRGYLHDNSSHCTECGAPIADAGVRSLRYWLFLHQELGQHQESGWLTLRQAHEFQTDTNERIDALRHKLERDRALPVIPVDDQEAPPPRRRRKRRHWKDEPAEPETPPRSFLEILLDPQSIQWLLAAGGALIALGLVIWLTAMGLFDEPLFVAVILGVGNAGLLAGGWFMILRTRFKDAGRALTLLACLVMPLNLWFYDHNQLLTLDQHLWIAALFCCAIYIASALVLKDALFVYVLVAGVTLTALLFLAEMKHFGEVFAPSAMLVFLALICLHAERAFPDTDGPLSRKQFGMAFYWSSLPLLAFGLLLLLGGQLTGWLHEPIFRHLGMANPSDVSLRQNLPWTLILVLAGTYALIYADLVVRKIGVYIYIAAFTILWAEVLVLIITELARIEPAVIIALALTALAVQLLQAGLGSKHAFLRTAAPLAFLLSLLPLAYGVLLHFRAVNFELNAAWPFEINWFFVGSMVLTALVCRAGAYLERHSNAEASMVYFFATAAATLVFAAGLLWMLGVKAWEVQAPLLMIVPILYLIASYLYRGHTPEMPLLWVAHGAVAVMLFCSLWVALNITPQVREVVPIEGKLLNLLLALFCLEAAIFYGLASVFGRTNWTIYFATVMFCGAVWQLLLFFGTPDEFYVLAFALIGFAFLVIFRLGLFENWQMPGLERALFQSANALTTLGFIAGALLALSRFVMEEDAAGNWRMRVWIMLGILVFLTFIGILSAVIVQHPTWRRVYLVFSIINAVLIAMMFHKLSFLSPWQKLEIFSIVVGVVLLTAGYIGWWRESDRASDPVSLAFLFGSIALVMPLLLAVAIWRFAHHDHDAGLDDIGLIIACVVLFGSGVLCRIKTPTFIGAVGMFLYLLMILIDLQRHLKQQWIIGIYLTLGGVVLFGSGLVLSIYRDKLLSLPDRIRRREGIFRIFDWRVTEERRRPVAHLDIRADATHRQGAAMALAEVELVKMPIAFHKVGERSKQRQLITVHVEAKRFQRKR